MFSNRMFPLAAALMLATACGPTSKDYDEDEVADDTEANASDTDTEEIVLEFGLWGSVEVDADNSYEGEEADYWFDTTNDEYFCLYTYQASGTPADVACDQCDFAFDVELTDGATTEGDCDRDEGVVYDEGMSFSYRMGFAATFTDAYDDDHDDVLFYYYYDSSAEAGYWYYYFDGDDGDISYSGGTLEWSRPIGYYYY